VRSLIVCAIALLAADGLAQDEQYDALSAQFAEAAARTWQDEIEQKFLDAMPETERELVSSIDFRFVPGGGAYDAFATRNEDGEPIILISGAFVAFQDCALDAAVMSDHFQLSHQMMPYLEYALEEGVKNLARVESGLKPRLVPFFAAYAQIPMGQAMQYAQSDDYQNKMMGFRIHGLAFVLAHEIGHHVHGDYERVGDAEQRDREMKADLYAVRLGLKSGFSPLAAIPVMMFFGEAGGDIRHPPPLCRLANLISWGVNDPSFVEYLKENASEKAKVDALRVELANMRSQIEADCDEWFAPSIPE
jgi:hypothetical protein